MRRYVLGQTVYIISSMLHVRQAVIIGISGGLYTLRFSDGKGGIRVCGSRLFAYRDEALDRAERSAWHSSYDLKRLLF